MTANRAHKRRIRDRQKATGETYKQAKVALDGTPARVYGLNRLLKTGALTPAQATQVENLYRDGQPTNLLIASNSTVGKSNGFFALSEHRFQTGVTQDRWLALKDFEEAQGEPDWGVPKWWTGDLKTSKPPAEYKDLVVIHVETPAMAHMMSTLPVARGFVATIEGTTAEEAVETFNSLVRTHLEDNPDLLTLPDQYDAIDAVVVLLADVKDGKPHSEPKVVSVTDLR